jgi:hypothetical protein
MNKLIDDRDYSAQEVYHYLLDLPLYHSSRSFVSVDLRLEAQHSHLYRTGHNGETRRNLSVLEKYKERDPQHKYVTYFQFLTSHNHNKLSGLGQDSSGRKGRRRSLF